MEWSDIMEVVLRDGGGKEEVLYLWGVAYSSTFYGMGVLLTVVPSESEVLVVPLFYI